MAIEQVWNRIVEHAGELFYTKNGYPFTYTVRNMGVIPDRTGYRIGIRNFEKALQIIDQIDGPGMINDLVRGPAYVYAILKDNRKLHYVFDTGCGGIRPRARFSGKKGSFEPSS